MTQLRISNSRATENKRFITRNLNAGHILKAEFITAKRLLIRGKKLKLSFYPAKLLMTFFSHQLKSYNYNCTIHLFNCKFDFATAEIVISYTLK